MHDFQQTVKHAPLSFLDRVINKRRHAYIGVVVSGSFKLTLSDDVAPPDASVQICVVFGDPQDGKVHFVYVIVSVPGLLGNH